MVNACKRDANTFMLVVKISEQKTELRIFKAMSGGLMNTFYVSKNILNVQAIEDTPILMVTYYERKQIKFAFDFLLQGANSAYKQIRIARTAQEQTDFLESSYFQAIVLAGHELRHAAKASATTFQSFQKLCMNKQYDNAIYQLSCIHLNQTR